MSDNAHEVFPLLLLASSSSSAVLTTTTTMMLLINKLSMAPNPPKMLPMMARKPVCGQWLRPWPNNTTRPVAWR